MLQTDSDGLMYKNEAEYVYEDLCIDKVLFNFSN